MIPFTQYLRPNGTARPVSIDRPPAIEYAAAKCLEAGCCFAVEELRTGDVSLTAELPSARESERVLSMEVVPNTAAVLDAVDRLISVAWARICERTSIRVRISAFACRVLEIEIGMAHRDGLSVVDDAGRNDVFLVAPPDALNRLAASCDELLAGGKLSAQHARSAAAAAKRIRDAVSSHVQGQEEDAQDAGDNT